jgi:hypothetical protein
MRDVRRELLDYTFASFSRGNLVADKRADPAPPTPH